MDYLEETEKNGQAAPTVLVMIEQRLLPKLGLSRQEYEDLGWRGGYQLIRVNKQLLLQITSSLPTLSTLATYSAGESSANRT